MIYKVWATIKAFQKDDFFNPPIKAPHRLGKRAIRGGNLSSTSSSGCMKCALCTQLRASNRPIAFAFLHWKPPLNYIVWNNFVSIRISRVWIQYCVVLSTWVSVLVSCHAFTFACYPFHECSLQPRNNNSEYAIAWNNTLFKHRNGLEPSVLRSIGIVHCVLSIDEGRLL